MNFQTHNLWACFYASLLVLPVFSCSQVKEAGSAFGRVLTLARREIVLRAPYLGIFDLEKLIEDRAQQVFATAETIVIPDTFMVTNEKLEFPPKNAIEVLFSLRKVSYSPRMPQTCKKFIGELIVNDQICPYRVFLDADFSTFKRPPQEVWLKWIAELSIPTNTPDKPIIPPGVSLNRLASHPNAPYIYNHLFKVVSAYRDILLDIVKRNAECSDHEVLDAEMLKEFDKHCWNTFIPSGSEHIKSFSLPASTLRILSYKVGHFVKKGALFSQDKINMGTIKTLEDFILISYKLEGDDLFCTTILINDSLEMSPNQQRHADHLIRAFGDGKLTLETYRNHDELLSILERDAKSILTSLKLNLPPLLHSYHPDHIKRNGMGNILVHVDIWGVKLASTRASRFESSVVQKRVFKAEHGAWWSTFVPGSRVTYSPQVTGSSESTHLIKFAAMDSLPHVSVKSQKTDSGGGSTKNQGNYRISSNGRKAFFMDAQMNRFPMQNVPATLEYPAIPIPHDPERVQKLLELAAQLLD